MKRYVKSSIYDDTDYLYDDSSDQWHHKESDWAKVIQKIKDDGYKPKYGMDNLVTMVFSYFDTPDLEDEYNGEYDRNNIEDLFRYVKDSGGWAEFDYLT